MTKADTVLEPYSTCSFMNVAVVCSTLCMALTANDHANPMKGARLGNFSLSILHAVLMYVRSYDRADLMQGWSTASRRQYDATYLHRLQGFPQGSCPCF